MAPATGAGQDEAGPAGQAGAVIGWDIGGAHLKAARVDGGRVVAVAQEACALWQGLDRLDAAFAAVTDRIGTAPVNAVTMTGELVDLFETRRDGVAALVRSAGRLAALTVYAGADGFVPTGEAVGRVDAVASANWHATAALVAALRGDALVVDMGSTTTDIVPVAGGAVVARSATDAGRLQSGELVYTGATRTPLMAVAAEVPIRGRRTAVMAEYFATMADVNRLLGRLADGADQHPTADGRGKSVDESRLRLSRMVGLDVDECDEAAWLGVAAAFAEAQLRRIHDAAALVASAGALSAAAPVVACGIGQATVAEVARRLGRPLVGFSSLVPVAAGFGSATATDGPDWTSGCAPAVAVALLAAGAGRNP